MEFGLIEPLNRWKRNQKPNMILLQIKIIKKEAYNGKMYTESERERTG